MTAALPRQRLFLATIASVAGIAVCWLTTTPFGLLAPVAALYLYAGDPAVPLLRATWAIAFAGAAIAGSFDAYGMHDHMLSWAAFFALALCIGEIVSAKASEQLPPGAVQAMRIIKSMPAYTWSASPDGHVTYVSASMLAYVSQPADEAGLFRVLDNEGWRRAIHPDDYARLMETRRHSLLTGVPFDAECRVRRWDGTYRWFWFFGSLSRDDQGRVAGWYGTMIDIDEKKNAEEALRRSERKLQQLIDTVPALVWSTTPGGTPSYLNKRLIDVVGVNLEDLTTPDQSRSLADIHPDDRGAVEHALAHSFETGTAFARRYRQRRAGGGYRWTEGRAEPLRDETGGIVQWYGVCVDIDDLVNAQDALQQNERRYRDLFHYMPIGLTQVDASKLIPLFKELRAQGVTELKDYIDAHPEFLSRAVEALEVEEVNQHTIEMFGAKNAAEMLGPITRYWQPGISTIRRSIEARYRGEEVFQEETKVARMDGSVIDVLFTTARPGSVANKSLVGFIDITERKRAEEARRRGEQQLQQLVDTVPVPIWCVTPTGEPAYVNKRMMDYIGMKLEDFQVAGGLRDAIQGIIHQDDRETFFGALNHSFRTGEPFVLKYRTRRDDGAFRWTEGRADPLRDNSGQIILWYGVLVDIDDLLATQEALRERERFLWQLVETLPAMIDCAAPDGEPVYRSQQLREFLGYELEELDGNEKSRLTGTLDAGVHPDDVAGVKEQYARSLLTGEPYARRHRLRRFDGEYRWVETRAAPMRNAESAIVQWNVICLDIDGEVRVQEELRLAQGRLARASQAASLAELSASIAHEVNQPLAAVVANSHACQRWLTADPPNMERARRTVERIIRDANGAADVVSRIRALFKQSVERRSITVVADLIAEVCDLMAEEAMRRRTRVDIDVEADVPSVALDRVQIQQVVSNLLRNGIEAMDRVAGDKVIRARVRRSEDAVRIEISDSGPGVEFPEKIFQPFFTTKKSGMGMGLAICRSIVESHGGRLWVEENEPRGAAFIFTLPLEVKKS